MHCLRLLLVLGVCIAVVPAINASLLLEHHYSGFFDFQQVYEEITVHEDGQGYDGHLTAYLWVNESLFEENNWFSFVFSPNHLPQGVVRNPSWALTSDSNISLTVEDYGIPNAILVNVTLPEEGFHSLNFEVNYTSTAGMSRTSAPHEYRFRFFPNYGPSKYNLFFYFPEKFDFSHYPSEARYTPSSPYDRFMIDGPEPSSTVFVYRDIVSIGRGRKLAQLSWTIFGTLLGVAGTLWVERVKRKKNE